MRQRDAVEVFVKDILAKYPQVREVRPYNLKTESSDILLVVKLDAFMFPAGVQHILDLKRPESVDLDRKSSINAVSKHLLIWNSC